MEDQQNMARCKQCDHLLSFHGEDGCGTWLLGVRAVPLYRCACVVSVSSRAKAFPTIPTHTFDSARNNATQDKTKKTDSAKDDFKAKLAQLRPVSETAPVSSRERLFEVAAELRRTAEELKNLEDVLENALQRLNKAVNSGSNAPLPERRKSNDRRKNNYAMIADRRSGDRRRESANV